MTISTIWGLAQQRKARAKVRFWEKNKLLEGVTFERARQHERETHKCCVPVNGEKCGKVAHYQVHRVGFCPDHKAEAYEAQAAWWKRQMKYQVRY